MFQIVLILFVSFSVQLAFSDYNVELYREPGMLDWSVRNQKTLGTCYASVAATLIDYEIIRKGKKQWNNVSSIDLAACASALRNKNSVDGGHIEDAIDCALKGGVVAHSCVVKTLNRQKFTYDQFSEGMTDLEIRAELMERAAYEWMQLRRTHYSLDAALNSGRYTGVDCVNGQSQSPMKSSLEATLSVVAHEFENCPKFNLSTIQKKPAEPNNILSNSDLKKFLRRIMKLEKKPVGLSICSSLFEHPKSRLVSWEKDNLSNSVYRKFNKKIKNCNGHGVVLIGIRENSITQKAEYLLKNSWGNWDNKGKSSCACKTKSAYYSDCKAALQAVSGSQQGIDEFKNKEIVGCWFEEEDVIPNTQHATYLPD